MDFRLRKAHTLNRGEFGKDKSPTFIILAHVLQSATFGFRFSLVDFRLCSSFIIRWRSRISHLRTGKTSSRPTDPVELQPQDKPGAGREEGTSVSNTNCVLRTTPLVLLSSSCCLMFSRALLLSRLWLSTYQAHISKTLSMTWWQVLDFNGFISSSGKSVCFLSF